MLHSSIIRHSRITAILLTLILCFSLFSCNAGGAGDPAEEAEQARETLPVYDSIRAMIADYTVVRSDISGDGAKEAMSILRSALGEHAKPPATDWVNERGGEVIPQNNMEILIGDTNRASSAAAMDALTASRPNHARDFSISFYDREVVIVGGSDEILPTAVQYFIDNMLDAPTSRFAIGDEITVSYAYPLDSVCGLPPESLVISAPASLQVYAKQLQDALFPATGFTLPLQESASGAQIILSIDEALQPKQYQISVKGDKIQMTAGNSITLSAAAEALANGTASDGKTYEGTYKGDVPFTPGEFLLSRYRTAIAGALTAAGMNYPITAIGASEGFDAIVTSELDTAEYTVDVGDNGIAVRAGHYLALEQALKEILSGKGLDGNSFSGIYSGDIPLTDGDMVLVWNDEFDGDTLDGNLWTLNAKMNQSDIKNGTDERNVCVTDGKLLMRSWREDDPDVPYSTNTSVTTDGTMSFRYGYLEIYANVPFMQGAWPSYWTQSKDIHRSVDYMTEVDIFEIFGVKNGVSAQLHKWNFTTGQHCQLDYGRKDYYFDQETVPTLNDEYHRYGFGWTPTEMYFTVDGEIFFSHDITENGNFGDFGSMQGFQDPLFVIFNNFLFTDGSSWKPAGALVRDDTEFPIEYSIEWIRLYQKPGEGDIFYDAYYK